ncbi:GNAT family N-acetyltransferase [Acidihalobacter ferrooxydans]|uniref:GNAT family N-acetyltransferase n=1 Tax=Acidihalobacter ferrooxydans TaxID=1765967 RepID=UPI0018DCCBDB|nr:GNAT family N-acetyltransferase [Acidihalobacter ferrooxydans]
MDLASARHGAALLAMMSGYACDAMGGGVDLSAEVKARLLSQLRGRPDYFGVLAFAGETAVGLVNCFEGFSTFQARPLLNVHDVFVSAQVRGQGLAQRMLAQVESEARRRGCCKLTMEVLEGNAAAQASYRRCGFAPYMLDPALGRALFWEKKLA